MVTDTMMLPNTTWLWSWRPSGGAGAWRAVT